MSEKKRISGQKSAPSGRRTGYAFPYIFSRAILLISSRVREPVSTVGRKDNIEYQPHFHLCRRIRHTTASMSIRRGSSIGRRIVVKKVE